MDLSLDRVFDYRIPEALLGQVRIGTRVIVPFHRSVRLGYVLDLCSNSNWTAELKELQGVAEQAAQLPEALIRLAGWMSDYYCCSCEQAVRTLLPSAVRSGKVKPKTETLYFVADRAAAEEFLSVNATKKNQAARCRILKVLLEQTEGISAELLLNLADVTMGPLKFLLENGLIASEMKEVRRNPFADSEILSTSALPPSVEQQQALDTLEQMLDKQFEQHVMLLFGVTNSGKTEVYLQSIAKVLKRGGSAIVLVPEISLTPQTVRRFRARFGDEVSVLHSRLSDGERFDEWNRIARGEVHIAVGARSALFAPFRNLQLIVVDEEHESNYKQSESPRYNARDVAIMRGVFENAVVMLGSATPSFESYNNALSGKYRLVEMKHKAMDCLPPTVHVADLRLDRPEPGEKKSGIFSRMLMNAVEDRLHRGEQTILFLNRRGYARQMMCESCGYVANCPECSVSYTYHRKAETLACHWCGAEVPAPECCPQCGASEIRYSGSGTEKIENMALGAFPGARVARLDSDVIRSGNTHEAILDRFRRGEIDILIGTQMIAKGLHFPNVTLVGVINADQGLNMPDFRACERTFQLLTQVAGRAGRGDLPGEVIIQTFAPENETILLAIAQDYPAFYQFDMALRTGLCYPPEGHLIVLNIASEDQSLAESYANECMEFLRKYCHDKIVVTEPGPAPIERLRNRYRYQILFRGEGLKQLRIALRHLVLGKRPKNVDLTVDVDAQFLM